MATEISSKDAISVAVMSANGESTKSDFGHIVSNVVPIYGPNGEPDIFAVNFHNNKGYFLVSASKCYYPILAEVDHGCYIDSHISSGESILIDEYIHEIEANRALSQECTKKFRSKWLEFEEPRINAITYPTSKSNDDLMQLISSSFAEWREDGYDIYDLGGGAPLDLPNSVYSEWYQIAMSNANEHYPFECNSFILHKRETIHSENGPLLSTLWYQREPYNLSIPNHIALGCSAVAIGQIIRFNEWPLSYNWQSMPNELDTLITEPTILSDFLYDVGRACSIHYSEGDSGTSIQAVRYGLTHTFHYSANIINHNSTDVYSEILEGYPVYMRGDNESGMSHAWVCDGARNTTYVDTYTLKVLSIVEPPLQFETPCPPYQSFDGNMSLHMNWGIDRSTGWYMDNLNYINGYYTHNRKEIINIRPNN